MGIKFGIIFNKQVFLYLNNNISFIYWNNIIIKFGPTKSWKQLLLQLYICNDIVLKKKPTKDNRVYGQTTLNLSVDLKKERHNNKMIKRQLSFFPSCWFLLSCLCEWSPVCEWIRLMTALTHIVWESNIPDTMPPIPAGAELIFAKPIDFFL